jgi:hypothetical protein
LFVGDGVGVGAGAEVAGSPKPGGRIDSGRSWAIAGNASTNASAALPARICLIRGGIGGDIALNILDRDFVGALGQQEQPADEQD